MKQISLSDVLNLHPPTTTPTTPLLEVMRLMGQSAMCCYLHLGESDRGSSHGGASYGIDGSQVDGSQVIGSQVIGSQTIGPQTTSPQAVDSYSDCVLVLEDGQLVGIVTEQDIVRLVAEHQSLSTLVAADIMSQQVVTLSVNDALDISAALVTMEAHQTRHLPVIDARGQLLGLFTTQQLRGLLNTADFLKQRHVREVMDSAVVRAFSTDSISQVTQLMSRHQVDCVVIVEKTAEETDRETAEGTAKETAKEATRPGDFRPLGVVTARDVVQFQLLALDIEKTPAGYVMSQPAFTVGSLETLAAAHQRMQHYRIRRLIVVSQTGNLLGLVNRSHLLAADSVRLHELINSFQARAQWMVEQGGEPVDAEDRSHENRGREDRNRLHQRNLELEQLVKERTQTIEKRDRALEAIVRGVAAKPGRHFLDALVEAIAQALDVEYAFVCWLSKTKPGYAHTIATYGQHENLGSHEYLLAGTPCENIRQNQGSIHVTGVQSLFPQDEFLRNLNAESYASAPLLNSEGEAVGLLSILSCQPLKHPSLVRKVLNIFAASATPELARQSAESDKARFFSLSLDLFCVGNLDGYFTQLNDAFETVLGHSKAEMKASPYLSFIHPSDRPAALQKMKQIAQGENVAAFENRYRCKDGSYKWMLWNVSLDVEKQLFYGTARDVTAQKQMDVLLRERARQQAVIARLGQAALITDDLDELMQQFVAEIAHTLNVEFCEILEYLPEQKALLLKAGVGWQPGLVGEMTVGADPNSQAGYTLANTGPVVVDELASETRFSGPSLLIDHHVVSGISLVIQGPQRPFGVLGVHTRQHRSFSSDDVNFVQSMAHVMANVIARKQAEQWLRESEIRFRTLVKSAPVGIFLTDAVGGCQFVNSRWQAMTGLPWEAAMGDGWSGALHPEDCDRIWAEWSAATQAKREFVSEYRFLSPDQSVVWVTGRAIALRDAAGNVTGYLGTVTDISDRKAAEIALQQSEAVLRSFFDSTPLMMGVVELQGDEIVHISDNLVSARFFGLSPQEMRHRGASSMGVPSDVVALWLGQYREAKRTQHPVVFEYSYPAHGKEQWLSATAAHITNRESPVENERHGGYPRFAYVIQDITQAKQLEAQFLRAQRLESLGTLASGIAHDLNNILTPIHGVAHLLPLQLPEADEQLQEQFKLLQSSTRRGAEIISQMLSFAKGVEGKRVPIQLKHLITEIQSFVYKTFPKSLEISIDLPTVLWTVRGDATQLHQVFMNLFVNARDAMASGGKLSVVATNLQLESSFVASHLEAETGPYVRVTVADDGIGIPADKLDRIFEPFFTTKQANEGSGLGLSTVHGIVKRHGGFITVDSQVGKGTRFEVYLPAIESVEELAAEERDIPEGNGECVLIVDDEAPIRQVAKSVLESHHYHVLLAENGIDAIAQYTQHQDDIDLVIMDMNMPELDGKTAIKVIQKINPDVQVIVASGLPSNEQMPSELESTVRSFLQKPYSAIALLENVHSVLSQ